MNAGFNSTLREGNVTHHENIHVGRGRDVGLNQISQFEAKIANGNGEQTLSRDIYRLGHRFDFFRMLSCYFTTVGSYFSTLVCCKYIRFSSRVIIFSIFGFNFLIFFVFLVEVCCSHCLCVPLWSPLSCP